MKELLLKIIYTFIYIAIYIFISVFYVQLYDGLHLEIYGWPTEIKSDIATIIQVSFLTFLSLLYLYVANFFLIGLNQLKLGITCSLAMFAYTYIIGKGINAVFNLYLSLISYPYSVVFIILVFSPLIVGFTLNKAVKRTAFPLLVFVLE